MKGAIMQPYFFPYLGYYQLAYEVEKFVFLDDVNFIKQGYINRNAILLNGKRQEFSLPVSKISSNRTIHSHYYIEKQSNLLKLIEQSYKKSLCFDEVMPIIEDIFFDADSNVARKNSKTITKVFNYLGLEKEFEFSSEIIMDEKKTGQDRIISLCQKLNISKYRNPIGGQTLYNRESFNKMGIDIKFIKTHYEPYNQKNEEFIPNLSMIDILMRCDKSDVTRLLSSYSLI